MQSALASPLIQTAGRVRGLLYILADDLLLMSFAEQGLSRGPL